MSLSSCARLLICFVFAGFFPAPEARAAAPGEGSIAPSKAAAVAPPETNERGGVSSAEDLGKGAADAPLGPVGAPPPSLLAFSRVRLDPSARARRGARAWSGSGGSWSFEQPLLRIAADGRGALWLADREVPSISVQPLSTRLVAHFQATRPMRVRLYRADGDDAGRALSVLLTEAVTKEARDLLFPVRTTIEIDAAAGEISDESVRLLELASMLSLRGVALAPVEDGDGILTLLAQIDVGAIGGPTAKGPLRQAFSKALNAYASLAPDDPFAVVWAFSEYEAPLPAGSSIWDWFDILDDGPRSGAATIPDVVAELSDRVAQLRVRFEQERVGARGALPFRVLVIDAPTAWVLANLDAVGSRTCASGGERSARGRAGDLRVHAVVVSTLTGRQDRWGVGSGVSGFPPPEALLRGLDCIGVAAGGVGLAVPPLVYAPRAEDYGRAADLLVRTFAEVLRDFVASNSGTGVQVQRGLVLRVPVPATGAPEELGRAAQYTRFFDVSEALGLDRVVLSLEWDRVTSQDVDLAILLPFEEYVQGRARVNALANAWPEEGCGAKAAELRRLLDACLVGVDDSLRLLVTARAAEGGRDGPSILAVDADVLAGLGRDDCRWLAERVGAFNRFLWSLSTGSTGNGSEYVLVNASFLP